MLKAKWQAASAESMFARMGDRMKILTFNLIASRNEHDRLVCRGSSDPLFWRAAEAQPPVFPAKCS